MIKTIKTDSDDEDFRGLVAFLDRELHQRDGDEHSFYAQFNKLDKIRHVIVAFKDDTPVGCGAIKEHANGTTEIKRMFVHAASRGQGIASSILSELELWAKELNYSNCILETGKKQPEAIALYLKAGYEVIPNYGQYIGVENSICMKKQLVHAV